MPACYSAHAASEHIIFAETHTAASCVCAEMQNAKKYNNILPEPSLTGFLVTAQVNSHSKLENATSTAVSVQPPKWVKVSEASRSTAKLATGYLHTDLNNSIK